MKYCANCGKKLAQATSKYCPQCGSALKDEAEKTEKTRELARKYMEKPKDSEKTKPASPAAPPRSLKERIARVVLAFALIAAFIFIGFYLPGLHWQRVNAVGAQYYEQLTIFNNDLSELNDLSNGYAGLPLDNATLGRKAAFASAYALKAKRALTSWNYFESFLTQNEGLLSDYNVKASDAKTKIDAQQSAVKREAQVMRLELTEFAGGDAAIANVTKALDEVDSKNAGQ